MEIGMDRRQKKSTEAIFRAFTELLCEYRLEKITVSQIIEKADIGRATFYAHFDTKDDLTRALCQDLFCHIFDGADQRHKHLFSCDQPQPFFVHLCRHLLNNDHQILALLVRQNNESFQNAFKKELVKLLECEQGIISDPRAKMLPEGYWTAYLADAFLSTVRWWYTSRMHATPEEIAQCFLTATQLQLE